MKKNRKNQETVFSSAPIKWRRIQGTCKDDSECFDFEEFPSEYTIIAKAAEANKMINEDVYG